MKIKTLLSTFSLLALIQIVSYSCFCERFYETFRLAEEGDCTITGIGLNTNNSPGSGAIDTIDTDSMMATFLIRSQFVETIGITSLSGMHNAAYATSPCDAEYYEAVDTLLKLEVFTVDSLGLLGPGASIFGKGDWKKDRADELVRSYNSEDNWGGGLNISIVIPKEAKGGAFGLRMRAVTNLDTVEVESSTVYWK